MCFSATASFLAAGALAPLSVVSLRHCRAHPPTWLFALAPLFFCVQQLIEGFIWLRLAEAPYFRESHPLNVAFLFFALFLWPFYMPLAALTLEPRASPRRRWLSIAAVGGSLVGCRLLFLSAFAPSYACISHGTLFYGIVLEPTFEKPIILVLYALFSTLSLFLSSRRSVRLYGLVGAIAMIVSAVCFRVGFSSVWCFFAALESFLVLFIVREFVRAKRLGAVGDTKMALPPNVNEVSL